MVRYGEQLTDRRSLLSFNELIIQFIPADLMTVSAAGERTSVDVILDKGVWIRDSFLRQSLSINHYKVLFLGMEIRHYLRGYVVTRQRTDSSRSFAKSLSHKSNLSRSLQHTDKAAECTAQKYPQ